MPASISDPQLGRGFRPDLPMPMRTLVGFAAALMAVLLIAFFTFRSLTGRERAAEAVTISLQTLQSLEQLQSSLNDAEAGQRGFLLTRDETYLTPFVAARTTIGVELDALAGLYQLRPDEARRIELVRRMVADKMSELDQTIALMRVDNSAAALEIVRSNRGKALMDGIRAEIERLEEEERNRTTTVQIDWQDAVVFSSRMTWGGSLILIGLIAVSAFMAARDHRMREGQSWVRRGQVGFSQLLHGEQRLDVLADNVLQYLSRYLEAPIAALYLVESAGRFRRIGGYALEPATAAQFEMGHTLLGQVAKDKQLLVVNDVPSDYMAVTSAAGQRRPAQLLIAPASADGVVYGVMEFGLFRAVRPADRLLIDRVGESLGMAIRASFDRTRLEELLQETQRQAEELQTQQEELRVNNEELEEQSRALRESQARLESQQTELEQTNTQVEEHMRLLEQQRDELRQAQASLIERSVELERSNQYKSEFLANMSHELRTPLNSSLILAKLLADNKEGNLTPEQVKFAQTISAAGHDLLTLINDILDLAKIEAGKVEVVPELVDVEQAARATLKMLDSTARERELALKFELGDGIPTEIETDPRRLGQILKNLLSNALKFTEKGSVTLRIYSPSRSTIAFAVIDTGIGIAPDQQSLIFDAFRQADSSMHRRYGGTGLGLSISRDLARLLGGEIALHSVVGEGSTFTLTLPVAYSKRAEPVPPPLPTARAAGAAPAAAVVPNAAAAPGLPRAQFREAMPDAVSKGAEKAVPRDDRDRLHPDARRLLVIEDDTRFAAILQDLAHELGFLCVLAHTAQEGLAAAQAYRPSAIVLDINLPDHSGIGVLDQLKRNPATRHIPVHVLSVADYTHEALERGAIGYDLKPVKREQLIDAFRHLEATFSARMRQVLIVEDDDRQRESMQQLLATDGVVITAVETGAEALERLRSTTFDCIVMDLALPDLSGYDLLERMASLDDVSFPPVIVYTGRTLSRDEEQRLQRYSKSIIIKDARSPERLLDEVTLFLHQVESSLPLDRQRMLQTARNRETLLDGRRILVVEDDARNIFALSSVLEPKGVKVEIARNGREALDVLSRNGSGASHGIDLILMDIMMPEMDGFAAMREIRRRPEWQRIPIIALTAKAMKDDQEKCLEAGANDYIAKPLDVERLLSLVRVWMPR